MKNLLMGHNHCQPNSNPGSGITCSSPYNLMVSCCPSLHPSAQMSSLGLQPFASMAHSSNSTLGTASTSASQSNSLIRPKLQSNLRLEERNKLNSESPSPNNFRLSHPTPMSNNSSASSSPSSPVPTHSFNMPPHWLAGYVSQLGYMNGKCFHQSIQSMSLELIYNNINA